MQWAQLLPGCNCCASLLHSCCQEIGIAQPLVGISVGSTHKQWTVNEGLLEKWFSQWWKVWWSSGEEWGKRQIQAFSQRLSSSPSLGPVGELEGLENRLGYGLQDSRALIRAVHSAWQQALRQHWISVPSPSLQPNSSGRLPCCSQWDLAFPPSHLGGLRSLTFSWVGHLAPSMMTAGQGLGT